MYEIKVTGEMFGSFMQAVASAKKIDAEVFEVETGMRRWAPAPKVSSKRIRQYREQASAYAVQEAAK